MVDFNDRRLGRTASPTYGSVSDLGDQAAYTEAYRKGWRHGSARTASLDNNPYSYHPDAGNHQNEAWDDGYTDNGVGREKYALRNHRFGTGDPVEGY